ncbi:MAG: aspartate carbamoyltransferase [Candidatus Cryptobacteroides sp.]
MRNLLDPTDFTVEEIGLVINRALDIIAHRDKYAEACRGKKLATLFYEPSTRTRLSFTAAMMELGGNVLGFSDAASSSVSKGETVEDTVRVVSKFADIIAMRHPKEGAPYVASRYSEIPIINAGDGGHSHPTQTLTDLLTIRRELGRFDHLTVGLCGDLKFGRTVHSLIKAMGRYEGVKFVLIAPEELALPDYIKHDVCDRNGLEYLEVNTLEEAMPLVDVLYMTRVQQERFADKAEYERLKDSFILDAAKMALAKEKMIVLHPLPRVNEIAMEVDADPRAAYFRQVENGKFVRMALIYTLLQWKDLASDSNSGIEAPAQPLRSDCEITEGPRCTNRHCITTIEPHLPSRYYKSADGTLRCIYCDHEMNGTI